MKIKEGILSSEVKEKEKKGFASNKETKDKLSSLEYRYHHQVHLEPSLKIKRDKISPLN